MITVSLALGLAFAADCPREPALRDPDGEVTALAQNLKFIITGEKRRERNALFADWLRDEGANVDLLLLSEARLTGTLDAWQPEWCFYTQVADGDHAYRWAPIAAGRPPAGLALGVRQRAEGVERKVGTFAGRPYRAKPTSLAEGFLGRLFNFEKGWAGVEIEDTHLVWSHTQASYWANPEKGAGREGEGRAGQFADLADDLGRPEHATLLTGDLNLLAGFEPRHAEVEPRIARARERDTETVATFRERTGIDLAWPWARGGEPREVRDPWPRGAGQDAVPAASPAPPAKPPTGTVGTFAGDIDRRRADRAWDVGAPYDRVGVNEAFLARHPGTRVRPVEITRGWLGVSDHLGLEIAIPFLRPKPAEPSPSRVAKAAAPRRSCFLALGRPPGTPAGIGASPLRLGAFDAPPWLEARAHSAVPEGPETALGVR